MCSNTSILFINFGGKRIDSPEMTVMVTWGLGAYEIGSDELIWVMAKEVSPICGTPMLKMLGVSHD